MAIYKGYKKISKIFVGSKEIKKVYKGTQLVYSSGLDLTNEYNLQYALVKGDITLSQAKTQGLIVDYTTVTGCVTKFMNDTSLVDVGYIVAQCTSLQQMYAECSNLKTFKYIDTSSAIRLNFLFQNDTLLVDAPICNVSSTLLMTGMFKDCTSINSVAFYSESVVPKFGARMFEGSSITTTAGTIYVPDELLEEWSNATNWVLYKTRFKPLSERAGDLGI